MIHATIDTFEEEVIKHRMFHRCSREKIHIMCRYSHNRNHSRKRNRNMVYLSDCAASMQGHRSKWKTARWSPSGGQMKTIWSLQVNQESADITVWFAGTHRNKNIFSGTIPAAEVTSTTSRTACRRTWIWKSPAEARLPLETTTMYFYSSSKRR